MKFLAGLVNVTDLGLAGTGVTDAGMSNVAGMQILHNIYVNGTKVTARGLAFIPAKQGISMMRVGEKPLSPQEYREVGEMFPRAEIFDPSGFRNPVRTKTGMEGTRK